MALECLSQRVIGSAFFLEESWMYDPWHGTQGLGAGSQMPWQQMR